MARRNTKRQKADKTDNRLAVFMVGIVIVFMAFIINARIKKIDKKLETYNQKISLLEEQIKEQEERKTQLESKEIYVKTDEYKIEVAKEKLGLVFPDEILIKPSE